jgi:hypothetical protein
LGCVIRFDLFIKTPCLHTAWRNKAVGEF